MGGVVAVGESRHEIGRLGADRNSEFEAAVHVAELGADLLLVVLAEVAAGHVRRDIDGHLRPPQLRPQLRDGLIGEAAQSARQVLGLAVVQPAHERDAPVHALVGDHGAVGGDEPRVRRHDDAVHPHAPGDLGGVQRSGSAVGHEVELPVVEPAVHGDQPHGAVHVLDGDRHDGLRGVLGRQPETVRDGVDGAAGPLGVEVHATTEEVAGVEPSHHDVGVGHRRRLAAEAVARRAGFGSGAVGPDLQQAAGVDGGDRPPAGADGRHVQDRQRKRQPELHLEQSGELQLAVDDDAHIGAGPAHVQRDGLGGIHRAGEVGAGDHPRGETREHDLHGLGGGVGNRHVAAVGPQQAVPAAHLEYIQFPQEVAGEVGDDRLDIGVHGGGVGPLVLAPDGRHLARDRDGQSTQRFLQGRCQVLLVDGIHVGEEQGHRHRGPLVIRRDPAHLADDAIQLLGGERRAHRTVGEDPLVHADDPVARHIGLGLDPLQVVETLAVDALDVEDVLEPSGCDEHRRRATPLDEGVRGDGRPHDEGVDLAPRVDLGPLQGLESRPGRLGRRGGDLLEAHLTARSDGDQVRERPPGVDADPPGAVRRTNHGRPRPAALMRPSAPEWRPERAVRRPPR